MRSCMLVGYLEVQSPLVIIRRDGDFLGGRDFQVLMFFRLHADLLRKQGVENYRAHSILYPLDHFIDDIFMEGPLGAWFHPQREPARVVDRGRLLVEWVGRCQQTFLWKNQLNRSFLLTGEMFEHD